MLLGRDVALKVLLPHLAASPDFRSRFESEARSLAGIDTPHVVRVLDYGVIFSPCDSRLPFMVLELLKGEDLLSVATREGPLDPRRMVGYMLQACAGLSAAHHLGIVHRDLKPENLFLAVDVDGAECLKILDFGVARSRLRRVHTQAGVGVGSPGYMAPEQVLDSSTVGVQADIWALGIVMYELLAHRPAFAGATPEALCFETLSAPLTPLAELRPDLPQELLAIVERCLERNPERRYADATALGNALAQFADQLPSSATVARAVETLVASEEPPPSSAPIMLSEDDLLIDEPVANAPTEPAFVGPWSDGASNSNAVIQLRRHPSGVRSRRALIAAGLIIGPGLALLPQTATALELESLRSWSAQAKASAHQHWQDASSWADGLLAHH
jgi:serine/threonine-protein kinase